MRILRYMPPLVQALLIALPGLMLAGALYVVDNGDGIFAIVAICAFTGALISAGLAFMMLERAQSREAVAIVAPQVVATEAPPLRPVILKIYTSGQELKSVSTVMPIQAATQQIRIASDEGLVLAEELGGVSSQLRETLDAVFARNNDVAEALKQAMAKSGAAGEQIAGFGEAMHRIGNMVYAIQSLAEQSNILALNATIEAARAGEAGVGFAAVAQEVKALAIETGRTTREINTLFSALQGAAGTTDTATRTISERLDAAEQANRGVDGLVQDLDDRVTAIARRCASATMLARSARDHLEQALKASAVAG